MIVLRNILQIIDPWIETCATYIKRFDHGQRKGELCTQDGERTRCVASHVHHSLTRIVIFLNIDLALFRHAVRTQQQYKSRVRPTKTKRKLSTAIGDFAGEGLQIQICDNCANMKFRLAIPRGWPWSCGDRDPSNQNKVGRNTLISGLNLSIMSINVFFV